MSVVFSSSRLTCWAAVPNCFIESPSIRAGGGRRAGAAARKRWWGHADSTAGDLGLCRQAGSRRKEHHSMLSIGVDIGGTKIAAGVRSEEHTSELQSRGHVVCRLLLEKKKPRRRRRNWTCNSSRQQRAS